MPVVSRRAFLAATVTLTAAFSQPYRTQSQNEQDETYPPRDWWRTSAAEGEFGVCPRHHQKQRRVCRRLRQRRGSSACFADVPLTTLRHIFLTHHHADHNADYGNLIWLAWTAGSATSAHNSAAMRPSGEGVSSDFLPPRPSQQSLRWTSRIAGVVCSARA